MTTVLLGVANENLVSDLVSLLGEFDDLTVSGVGHTTTEVVDLVARHHPDLLLLHENLGPDPAAQVIRDLAVAHPALGILQVSPERSAATVVRAMEAGARGVVAHPFAFEDVSARLQAAREWSSRMMQILQGNSAAQATARGRVVAVCGAKGGTGVTTLALHLAVDHHRSHPHDRVCVVDLDVEKGDVSAVLEVRQSVSVADLAKVHLDISPAIVSDALIEHESGVHLLLAPADVRETELITPEAIRPIFNELRKQFDVVIVDCGGHVSPTQAAAVEIADETVVVVTADVLAMRALRKRVLAWESLGVVQEASLRVLVNKVDRASIFPPTAVAKLTTASVLPQQLPDSRRVLEAAMNERDPRAVTEVAWWRLISGVRAELGLDMRPVDRPRSRRRQRARVDGGQASIESVVVIPLTFFVVLIAWQICTTGLTALWSGNASRAAARQYSISRDLAAAESEARAAVPDGFSRRVQVSASGQSVTVRVAIPAAGPAGLGFPQAITSTRSVVTEPR